MADIWGEIIKVAVPALASVAGGYLSGQAGASRGKAEEEAAREALRLQREIYYDTRGLARPGYMTGGAATNLLASQLGITPQDYTAAYNGGNVGPIGFSGAYNPADWGAGQPVAGHSGGGGSSGLASAGLGAVGTYFGGPIGGALGSLAGGLIRKGGDNWQTLGTSAPQGFAYDEYFNSSPEFAKEWSKPDVQSLFNGNRDAYIWWHANGGNLNGKQSWAPNTEWLSRGPTSGNMQSPQPVGGAQQQTTTSGLPNPMSGFLSSPYGQIAVEGFRGVDVPGINDAFAKGGKVFSGAQNIALDERGKARLGGAYNDYTNALRSLSGLQQTASSQIGGAANQYGSNAGNAIMAAGQAKGNALESAYKGLGQGITGAFGAFGDYLKRPNSSGADPAQLAYPGYY